MTSPSTQSPPLFSKIAIAPMIDWTYMHFRVFMRILAPNVLLYTEMQTTGAVEFNPQRALEHCDLEHPIALQLGGSDRTALARSTQIAEVSGFAEVNLNLGCPSDRVQAGRFGACLMAEPQIVNDCISAMKDTVSIPVSAKIRIGIDEQDSYQHFADFAHGLVHAGCDKIIIHARKAWLNGLSPKQNRTIPPLHYDYVYRLKKELPNFPIVINGNIQTREEVNHHLSTVEGVMLGRVCYQNPYRLAEINKDLYPETLILNRDAVLQRYLTYVTEVYRKGERLSQFIKPLLNLTHGLPGARLWREKLTLIQREGDITPLVEMDTTDLALIEV